MCDSLTEKEIKIILEYILTTLECKLTIIKDECTNNQKEWNSEARKNFYIGKRKGFKEVIDIIKENIKPELLKEIIIKEDYNV